MTGATPEIVDALKKLDPASPSYATQIVDLLLAAAQAADASDLHLQPTPAGLAVRWRLDGVLQLVSEIPRGLASDVVARLKVMAELPTYKADVPQEGRIRQERPGVRTGERGQDMSTAEMRVSTFPTLHGERAVVRLFASGETFSLLADLQFPSEIEQSLTRSLHETSGAILLTGPAGSGKTTTAYACLRQILKHSGESRNLVTLEDPIEVAIPRVSQSQVQATAGFTLATGLRSLMRQDPEVVLIGEVRDRETSEAVFQAALTGHLVISTFHAGGAAGAISRLLDMGIEPYLLTSGLKTVLHQRLLRRLCSCAGPPGKGETLGLRVSGSRQALRCAACRHTGYRDRFVLAELLPSLVGALRQAVLERSDRERLEGVAAALGMKSVLERACSAVEQGQTDASEVRRIHGFVNERNAADC